MMITELLSACCLCCWVYFSHCSALNLFMRKKQVNVFLSSPVDRRTMYKNRVVASLLMMAGATVIPIIADIIINACLVGHFGYVLQCGVLLFAECFIYTAAGFALMSLAMSFCTTVVESFFFCGAVAGVPTSVSYFIHSLCYTFLSGYNHKSLINFYYDEAFFAKPSLLHYTSLINPLILGKAFGADYSVSDNIINLFTELMSNMLLTAILFQAESQPVYRIRIWNMKIYRSAIFFLLSYGQ